MRQRVHASIIYGSLTAAVVCAITVSTLSVSAQTILPDEIPIPLTRPAGNANSVSTALGLISPQTRPAVIDALTTAFIGRTINPAQANPLTVGLNAISARNIGEAIALRNLMPEGSLDRKILTWAIATSGDTSIPSSELALATKQLATWPNIRTIDHALERATVRETTSASALMSFFSRQPPQTVEGIRGLALAYMQEKQTDKAAILLKQWWPEAKLSAAQEKQFISDFGGMIGRDEHRARLIHALYANNLQSAEQLATVAQAKSLVDLFQSLSRNRPDTAKKIAAIDSSWHKQSIYQFAQIRYLRINGKLSEAAALMQRAPKEKAELLDPDAWWNERRILSRDLLDIGQAKLAYKIVSGHAAESPAMAADAEFHAGWYALRMLNDPKLATSHFKNLEAISRSGQSLSRAYYWLARAADAGSDGSTQELYAKASQYRTSFYGQLAAAKLDQKTTKLPYPHIEEKDKSTFKENEVVRAIQRLETAGYGWRANSLYQGLAQQLDAPSQLALLAEMAEANSNHYLALRIAKTATTRGFDVGAMTHPIGAIPSDASISDAGLALAYAIARQESEFNIGAVSHAGALGLLQLMPTTAKAVATRAGLTYSAKQLTNDAAYNATLGSHYLSEQLDRFDGSYILTTVGYNAGPNRANEWVQRYGSPNGKSLDDVIDWIERIPYPETRNYVQRVMENYEVYRLRLHGKSDIVNALRFGRS